jgi:hypothetical protein
MTPQQKRRLSIVAAAVFATLIALAILLQIGARILKGQVEKALGPESEVADIRVGWGAVEVRGLRLKGGKGWPAEDTFRASRILVEPDLRSLFSDRIHISSIVVEGAYLSALRAADGHMRVVPSLLGAKSEEPSGHSPQVSIGRFALKDAALEFFDATVARPPLKIRVEQLNATIDDVELPDLASRTAVNLEGILKGRHHDGQVAIKGWIILASLDSSIASRFRGVDLVSLQPYLIKAAETGVRRGSLDLDLDARVERKHLHAPGTITLRNLELDTGGHFMGHAREAALAAMKDARNEMTVRFVLEGNLDDPTFSVNDNLATRFGSALGETLGVSVEGVAKGVGSLGQKSLEAAAGGVGKAFKNLLGK